MRFKEAISANQQLFGLQIGATAVESLAEFYGLIEQKNALLHLVAPMTVEAFVVRHILESLMLLEHLPFGSSFADIGTGAGLPSIPCLIVRPDLKSVLIESKLKKCGFLTETVAALGLADRAIIVNRQFAEISAPDVDFVTCRALDKFSDKLAQMISWAGGRPLLLFAGPKIGMELAKNGVTFESRLMPGSEQRYLFICQSTAPR